MTAITILKNKAMAFESELHKLKTTSQPDDFTWYAYNSMGNFPHLELLLSAEHADAFSRNHELPMLDIGAADGDIAFFLERQGFRIDIIDNSPTNWNGLRGAYRLRKLLNSNVGIHEVDLDAQFALPDKQYGLAIFLGILYHLKNPFYVLEQLSYSAKELLLSTRIARYFKQCQQFSLDDIPTAYLLASDECNNDATNYWIFTRTGLERILQRAGWEIEAYVSVGDTKSSNPSDAEHDERAFLLAKSLRG